MSRRVRILSIFLLLLVALISCGAIVLLLATRSPNPRLNPIEAVYLRVLLASRDQDLKVPAGSDTFPVCFTVNRGDTANVIGTALQRQGFVKDSELFRNYVRYYGIDAQLQAGVYSLRKSLTLPEIAQSLTNAGANTVTLQVIEGWRMEETAGWIDKFGQTLSFNGADYLRMVGVDSTQRPDFVNAFATKAGIPAGQSLEGFLFPDTYVLPACVGVDQLVSRMLNNFDNKVNDLLRAEAQKQGLNLYQAVTLASIVEREAVVADERPQIAGVYLNRLKANMKLDADPTVQYGIANRRDTKTWWPQITADDYQNVQHPYNTYRITGLPPGPIASPGFSSIQAAIQPQPSQYLYFRAGCANDGRHKFATTFEEHLNNACP